MVDWIKNLSNNYIEKLIVFSSISKKGTCKCSVVEIDVLLVICSLFTRYIFILHAYEAVTEIWVSIKVTRGVAMD